MFNWYHSLSLLSKQILIIVSINAICLSVASILYFFNHVNAYKDRQINEIESKSKVISGTLTTALLFQDIHAAYNQLQSLDNDKHLLYVGVFDANANFFANYVGQNYFKRPNFNQLTPGIHETPGQVSVLQEILLDGELMGYLYLVEDTHGSNHQLINHALITLLVFILSLLLAYTLSLMLRKWLTKPIKDLVQLIQHITSSNDFSQRLEANTNDEVGQLIQNFNRMIDAIQIRDLKLKAQGEELQDLVNLRTRQLYQRANYDNLTKLPNRHFFTEKLEKNLYHPKDSEKCFAIVFIDLDRFKNVNDNLGHNAGDKVLSITARRLGQLFNGSDQVARWGGDEFVLFVNDRTQSQLEEFVKVIRETISQPLVIDQHELLLTACIGISFYPQDGTEPLNLLKRANMSANKAKQKGAGTIVTYSPDMDDTSKDQLSLETKLRKAVERKTLTLVYQPKVRVSDQQLAGVEALLRWQDDDLGYIPPSQFIPLAEEIGIINQIGDFVIDACCQQHAHWRLMGFDPVRIALNLSPSHLADPGLCESLEKKLNFYQIAPEYIELEITEETFLDADQQCQYNLKRLHKLGLSIALDDFGTGYSCLSYLVDIPVTTLKIDGSFIRKLGTRAENDGIVKAILALGHGLGLTVVAECVETKAQWQFLKNEGCDIIQGFYFSKPLTSDKLETFMNNLKPSLLEQHSAELV